MDLSSLAAPKSDQLDAIDLDQYGKAGRTFTIERLTPGPNAEQELNVHLVEFPRPWRPNKSMIRVLRSIWGTDGKSFAGRRITLWCDPEVPFGGIKVGGVRILAMSGIDRPREVPILVKRGKSAMYTVQPLPDAPPAAPAPTPEQIAECIDETTLRNWWIACPDLRDVIQARVAEVRLDAERAAQIDAEAGQP